MAIIVKCDNCGEQIKQGEMCNVRVQLPPGIGTSKMEEKFVFTMRGPQRVQEVEPEDFHLCPGCGTQLVLAMKQTKKSIMRGQLVWKE